jgi:hypothetical protein
MPLGEPPTYDVATLERKAAEFLRTRFGQDVPIPVDVDLLLEQTAGVDLDVWPALRDNHGLEGMICRDAASGELIVYIDEWLADNRPTRYRMTVAEELAHVLLHRTVIEQIDSPAGFQELQKHPRWFEMDRNAKRFAAAILMPGEQVTREAGQVYSKLVRAASFGDAAAINKYLAAQLAKQFEVSPQAMTFRLREWPMKIEDRVDQAMRAQLDYL